MHFGISSQNLFPYNSISIDLFFISHIHSGNLSNLLYCKWSTSKSANSQIDFGTEPVILLLFNVKNFNFFAPLKSTGKWPDNSLYSIDKLMSSGLLKNCSVISPVKWFSSKEIYFKLFENSSWDKGIESWFRISNIYSPFNIIFFLKLLSIISIPYKSKWFKFLTPIEFFLKSLIFFVTKCIWAIIFPISIKILVQI